MQLQMLRAPSKTQQGLLRTANSGT
jgi:hypothetical protein